LLYISFYECDDLLIRSLSSEPNFEPKKQKKIAGDQIWWMWWMITQFELQFVNFCNDDRHEMWADALSCWNSTFFFFKCFVLFFSQFLFSAYQLMMRNTLLLWWNFPVEQCYCFKIVDEHNSMTVPKKKKNSRYHLPSQNRLLRSRFTLRNFDCSFVSGVK